VSPRLILACRVTARDETNVLAPAMRWGCPEGGLRLSDGESRGSGDQPFIGLTQASFQALRDGVPINTSAFGTSLRPVDDPSPRAHDLGRNAVSVPSSTQ
jgi:hypothetical protein